MEAQVQNTGEGEQAQAQRSQEAPPTLTEASNKAAEDHTGQATQGKAAATEVQTASGQEGLPTRKARQQGKNSRTRQT